MVEDLPVDLIPVMVQLEQPLRDGTCTAGAGFLVADTDPDGRPRTILMDFLVFPGNSGGPVFMAQRARRRPRAAKAQDVRLIAGILTQQLDLSGERLDIGAVIHAR